MGETFKLNIKNKEAVIAWLNEIKEGTGDATPLWKAVTPKIIDFVNYELDPHSDGHKLWPRLKVDYLIWKIRTFHVSGIGYLTGAMQNASGESAIKKYSPKSLLWRLNPATVIYNSENGFDYSQVFHKGKRDGTQKARPLYKYTSLRINSFLKLDAKKFNDGSHASFTYLWLKNSLEKGQK
jgi:hypothetical protein